VAPGITLIALVSDAPGTKELKELSLAIDTPDGSLNRWRQHPGGSGRCLAGPALSDQTNRCSTLGHSDGDGEADQPTANDDYFGAQLVCPF